MNTFKNVKQTSITLYIKDTAKVLNVSHEDIKLLMKKGYNINALILDGFKYKPEIIGNLFEQIEQFNEQIWNMSYNY